MPRLVLVLSLLLALPAEAALRFHGHGVDDVDRVKIRIDDPSLPSDPGPPVDVGATDFTLELFLRGRAGENTAAPITCGPSYDWIQGNIVLDRDRFNQGRGFGLSLVDGRVAFGVLNDSFSAWTLCGTSDLLDDRWHHVAVQRRRSDGRLELFVDGVLEAAADGPDGDLSYPDDGVPGSYCGAPGQDPCTNSDPFVVLGAEKHDAGSQFPSFAGWLDEVRFSTVLRYAPMGFPKPRVPFVADAETAALYPLDGTSSGPCTGTVPDTSGAAGGPSDGVCVFGGSAPAGPLWDDASPFVPVPAVGGCAALLLFACMTLAAGLESAWLRRRARGTAPR